jgi:DNA polymerase-1
MATENRLFLLDGMALIYRAHFAFVARPIVTSYGLNASALYGFTSVILDLLRNEHPSHMAVVFDTSAPTARHVEFPAYKAQREEMPEDLSRALPHMKRIIEAFRIPVISRDGYEADDLIGTLARRAEDAGFTTFMVTADKDFAQLVDSRTFIWKPGRQGSGHEIIGVPEVQAQWQVERPSQVIDVLGLWGDSVDNFPGVPGIGEKTAKALIQQWGSIENLLANTDKLKGRQQENLITYAEQARLCRRLATIWTDCPLEIGLDDLVLRGMDEEALRALLVEFEFTAIGKRLFGDDFRAGRGFHRRAEAAAAAENGSDHAADDLFAADPAGSPAPVTAALRTLADTPHAYTVAATAEARRMAYDQLQRRREAGFSLDWDGEHPRNAHVRGVALSMAPGEAVYLTGAPHTDLLRELAAELPGVLLTGYDLKPALQILALEGLPCGANCFDAMVAQAVSDPEQRQSLAYLSEALLGYTPGSARQTEASGQLLMAGLEEGDAGARADAAMERADVASQVAAQLRPKLTSLGLERVFFGIEMPLLPVLARMEAAGIRIDAAILRASSGILEARIRELEEAVFASAGTRFNLNSPRQLGQILFDHLKLLEKPRKTKTGQYVTGEEVLQELAAEHRIAADLLEWREASKLKSTYVDALPGEVSPRTGRIHTTFLQASTSTGRLASNHPNLQNIPIRSEQGRAIRRAFVPASPDHFFLSADYSQIELRVMASLSRDPAMMDAFRRGEDIHRDTAARVYGVPSTEVTADMRRTAKMVNFGIIYGISAFGLAQRLGIPRSEGARLIDGYFLQYPGVKEFIDRTIADAKDKGWVTTMTGRRRPLRDIRSANATVRKAAERTATNTPIQGTAADMIKLAMVHMDDALRSAGLRSRMILQVHDELLFEVPAGELDTLRSLAGEIMRSALPLDVPIVVEMGSGQSWFEAHA